MRLLGALYDRINLECAADVRVTGVLKHTAHDSTCQAGNLQAIRLHSCVELAPNMSCDFVFCHQVKVHATASSWPLSLSLPPLAGYHIRLVCMQCCCTRIQQRFAQ